MSARASKPRTAVCSPGSVVSPQSPVKKRKVRSPRSNTAASPAHHTSAAGSSLFHESNRLQERVYGYRRTTADQTGRRDNTTHHVVPRDTRDKEANQIRYLDVLAAGLPTGFIHDRVEHRDDDDARTGAVAADNFLFRNIPVRPRILSNQVLCARPGRAGHGPRFNWNDVTYRHHVRPAASNVLLVPCSSGVGR